MSVSTDAFNELQGYVDELDAEGSASADVETLRGMLDRAVEGVRHTLEGCVELPVGRDGLPICVGCEVYGSDGRLWRVASLNIGSDYPVVVTDGTHSRSVRPEGLLRDRTAAAVEVIRAAIEECGATPLGDDWLTDVARSALDLRTVL